MFCFLRMESSRVLPPSLRNLCKQVAHEDLFMAQGPRLLIDSYPIEKAVAISDTLFGRKIEVALTCDQEYFVPDEEACVVFKLNFTNSRCVYVLVLFVVALLLWCGVESITSSVKSTDVIDRDI